MKTWMTVLSGGAWLAMAGCSGGTSVESTSSKTAASASAVVGTPVTQRQVEGLLKPEPGSPVSDYSSKFVNYRLLGVQPGDGTNGFATLMDTKTYATRNVKVGEPLSRNVMLKSLGQHDAEFLSTTAGPLHVASGKEFGTTHIFHSFDRTSEYLGKNEYRVSPDIASRVHERYGAGAVGEAVQIFGRSGIRLSNVNEQGSLGRLGFRDGDIVLGLNGQPVSGADVDGLARQLVARSSQDSRVTVSRGGNVSDFHFTAL